MEMVRLYLKKINGIIFGRVTSNKHNQDRSIQLEKAMRDLGIQETPESKKILLDHLDDVARKYPPIAGKSKNNIHDPVKTEFLPNERIGKHSFFTGPSGVTVKLETIYQICDDGSLRFITTIPKILKPNYGAK